MSRVVEWPLDGGETIRVEVADEDLGPERVGRSPVGVVGETLEHGLRRLRPAISAVVGQMRDAGAPDRVTVRFGVKVTVAAGAVIAKSGGEANFEISVEWARPTQAGDG